MTGPQLNIDTDGCHPGAIGRNNIDFCRFGLSVMVIFSHSFALAEGHEHHEPLRLLTNGQIGCGGLSVCCFFAISGFLITHSWLRSPSAATFLFNRVLRIYPGFIVAVLLGVFLVAPIASPSVELPASGIWNDLANLVALHRIEPPGVFATNPFPGVLNGSLWSIPYEFKCYLGLMLLGAFGVLSTRKQLLAPLLIVILVGGAFYPQLNVPSLEQSTFAVIAGMTSVWFRVLPYFVVGAIFYLARDRIAFSSGRAIIAITCVGLACLVPPISHMLFPVLFPYLLLWFAFHPIVNLHNWARYGDFSYGIYLYAFPIQQLIVMWTPGISAIALFAIATPLSIVAGVISWFLVEKHFLKMKRRS